MIDPRGELRPALQAMARADAGVKAAFGNSPVRAYAVPPTNATPPYLVFGQATVDDAPADGMRLSSVIQTVDVISLTDPPGYDEAEAIADALKAMMLQDLVLPSFRIGEAVPEDTIYLLEKDGQTVHAVVRVTYPAEPL